MVDNRFVSQSCPKCGAERWVRKDRLPNLCKHCQITALGHSNKGQKRLYIPRPHMRGEKSSTWKGGRFKSPDGYIYIYIGKDDFFSPMATSSRHRWGGYILEHRLVIAKYLKRCLDKTELVHHKDGDRQNNIISNLVLSSKKKHPQGYSLGYKQGFADAEKLYGGKNDLS